MLFPLPLLQTSIDGEYANVPQSGGTIVRVIFTGSVMWGIPRGWHWGRYWRKRTTWVPIKGAEDAVITSFRVGPRSVLAADEPPLLARMFAPEAFGATLKIPVQPGQRVAMRIESSPRWPWGPGHYSLTALVSVPDFEIRTPFGFELPSTSAPSTP